MKENYFSKKKMSKRIFDILEILCIIFFIFLILYYMTSCTLPPTIIKANEDNQIKTKVLPSIPNNPTPLPKMLNISWNLNPDLPKGGQDFAIGIINNLLILTNRFCQGLNNDMKPGKYDRGFFKDCWAFDGIDGTTYQALPEFPGCARQNLLAITVNNEIYMWGGYNYTAPYSYSDGWKLSYSNGNWIWTKLPDLPYALCYAGITVVHEKICIFGGCRYDGVDFTDNNNNLISIDTNNLSAGWTVIQNNPPVKKCFVNLTYSNNELYMIGGVNLEHGKYYNTIDNWRYNLNDGIWTRLSDFPISCTGTLFGNTLFHDRYIVLVGGYQYDQYLGLDGQLHNKIGIPSQFVGGAYYNEVLVYDIQTNSIGRADYLPINNATPAVIMKNNQLYIIGGEADPCYIDGIFFGHHPDLNLVGIISE